MVIRRTIISVLYEIIALLICIWLLEAIGYIDFIADATYNVELVTRRLHAASIFSGILVLLPPLMKWRELIKLTKEGTKIPITKALSIMLLTSIRGGIYALILSQWNIFQLQQYVIHCSQ